MAYNMSKAAIEHMARTAAIEVAEHRIRINLIQPGWTDTPGELKFASRETLDTAGAKIPLGRLGTAEEMAEASCSCAIRRTHTLPERPCWSTAASACPGGPTAVPPLRR